MYDYFFFLIKLKIIIIKKNVYNHFAKSNNTVIIDKIHHNILLSRLHLIILSENVVASICSMCK